MIRDRWFTNPVFVFIFSLCALGTSFFLYIRSYLGVSSAFHNFLQARNLDSSQFLETETWVMILILSILVAIILICLIIIFVYYQKIIQLYRMQQNFISGFTHELKTPIASLRLFLETFSRHEIPREEQLKYLAYMQRDTERLAENVNEILNLAKLEEKKYEAEFVVQDLYYFVEDWAHKSPHMFVDCEFSMRKLDEGDYLCRFEPHLMELVIMNLVTNAINYSEGMPKIELRFRRSERFFHIDVADRGVGISKIEQKKIFKKFYQIGKTTKGSGLGLYLVGLVAKMHKGAIHVHSEGPGKGSTFTFSLPRKTR